MSALLILLFFTGISAFFLTWVLRRYALARSLMDVPNSRSSHTVPTPRGGGLAIVLGFLCVLPLLYAYDAVDYALLVALMGACALVAIIGFLDDHGHIPARWRLLGHFGAAIWALAWLGGVGQVSIFSYSVDAGIIGCVIACFYLVWMLNLYNFMDGIDGLASVQAITVCLGVSVLYGVGGHLTLYWAPLFLAFAVAGFICWNFPPAKIFMGDAGSGFLGIALGVLSIRSTWVTPDFIWVWLIMMGVFIVDATFTLLRRLLRGEKVYEAHRSHAYQYASRAFGKHLPVTATVAVINIFWLFPVAFSVAQLGVDGVLGLAIAYLPLAWLAVKFKAGKAESE